MAVDATGQAIETGNTNSNVNSSNSNSTNVMAKGKNSNSNVNASDGGAVTRNIKGKKEVMFIVAALKGKGYPAPVNLAQN
jgi:hypothetical protein